MSVIPTAVAFDVFGTICGGHAVQGPYARIRDLFGIGKAEFRLAAMTRDIPLLDLVQELRGCSITDDGRSPFEAAEQELRKDCQQIVLFADAIATLRMLRDSGVPYGLISNLGQPYADPVIKLLRDNDLMPPPELCVWSFREGVLKPDPEIYSRFCERIELPPAQVLVVGDTHRNDLVGPRVIGCQSRLLVRDGDAPQGVEFNDVIKSLIEVPQILGLEVTLPRLDHRSFGEVERGQELRP